MNYNKNEINLINDATAEASVAIDTAHALMSAFYEKYLDDETGARSLAFDAEIRFDFLENQIRAIFNMICQAKTQLDIFAFGESDMLNARIRDALEAQKIIELKNEITQGKV